MICGSQVVEVCQTAGFRIWLSGLDDSRATERIAQRIVRLEAGLAGDVRPVGGGVSEVRIDYGPGYCVYFIQRGRVLTILLCGGDKSTQSKDIRAARALAADIKEQGA